jgi:RNA polymerase sigma-70 factor (ECF subfamily)
MQVSAQALPITAVNEASAEATDEALVLRVKNGDTQAFDLLVRKYRNRVYSVIYNMTANAADASDLTQDAFIKAFQSINRFRGNSAFYTWLYRIAVNGALSHLKKSRRRHFFSLQSMDASQMDKVDVFAHLRSKSEAHKGALLGELQEKLNEALMSLSLNHRTAIVLHEIEGLPHQEIARITGTSVGTVRSRLHYAKKLLHNDLKAFLE